MLSAAAYREAFQRDAAVIASAARQGFDVPVPSCPGWTVGILVAHLAGIYAHRVALARARATTNLSEKMIGVPPAFHPYFDFVFAEVGASAGAAAPPPPAGLLEYFEQIAAELVDTLWGLDPAVPIWTWWPPDQTAGFWQRRMALETAVHRWDTELAYGQPQAVESNLGADGVDEVLDVLLTTRLRGATSARRGAGERYHFHRTDGPGEWLVRFEPEGPVVSHEHARGDVALRGTGGELFLWLWHRIPADGMEVYGDTALLERFFALVPPS